MRNPLNKRFKRELKSGLGRYIVIFLLLFLSIGEVSGFLVADHSLITAYEESFEKYNIEDGNFETADKLTKEQTEDIEKENVTLFENFYTDKTTKNDTTLRLFKNRSEVDKVSLLEGDLPKADRELAIDRLYAKNNDIKIGDKVNVASAEWTVSGIVALSDYSTLFKENTDMMFDTTKFGVGVVSESGWKHLDNSGVNYRYSWKYRNAPADEKEEKKVSDDLADALMSKVMLTDYVPRYLNQAIMFTGEDFGQDRAMMQLLLYIIIVIIAFIFAVTVKNMINREAPVIGTLLASGYKKGELLRHYMLLPVLVTIAGAVAGNILGYTLLKDLNADAYYGSYSLPAFKTLWNAGAFIQTTLIPVGIVMLINFFIIRYSLSFPPLNFLRGDLSRKGGKKATKLSHNSGIMSRFRRRILGSNTGSYAVLAVGIFFSNVLLLFGFMLPSVLDNYKNMITDNMIAEYTYILKAPVETEKESAEKFAATTLKTPEDNGFLSEDVTVYGVEEDSSFVSLEDADKTYISRAYADKYKLSEGDTFTLEKKYEDGGFDFTVDGIFEYEGGVNVYTGIDNYVKIFDEEAGVFNGYYSSELLDDIDEDFVATVIDKEEMTKVSRQLELSLGSMMGIVRAFSVVMFVIIIYILSRLIIEKSAKSISLTKVLGYKNKEIGGLYIISTSIVVIASILATLAVSYGVVGVLYREMLAKSMTGWMPYVIDPSVFVKMIAIGIGAYAAVALLELIKIRKVPMNMALKEAVV